MSFSAHITPWVKRRSIRTHLRMKKPNRWAIRQFPIWKSFWEHYLNIFLIFLSSLTHEMHVGKPRIGVTTRVVRNPCSKQRFKPKKKMLLSTEFNNVSTPVCVCISAYTLRCEIWLLRPPSILHYYHISLSISLYSSCSLSCYSTFIFKVYFKIYILL